MGERGSLRESKDLCINADGEEMLTRLGELGMQIMTGWVDVDEGAGLTYLGPMGSTVIDYLVGGMQHGRENRG